MLNVFSTLNVFPDLTKSGVKLVAGKSEAQVVPDRGAAFSPRYRQNHPHGGGFAEKRSGGGPAAGHATGADADKPLSGVVVKNKAGPCL